MRERPNRHAWKACVGQPTVGSNPTSSAMARRSSHRGHVLGAAIIGPVAEELFFRGFALTAWRRDLGDRAALLRATAFFAIVHVLPITGDAASVIGQAVLLLVVLTPVGYVFGWLFLRYGMVGAISGHISYNSILLLLAFLAGEGTLKSKFGTHRLFIT